MQSPDTRPGKQEGMMEPLLGGSMCSGSQKGRRWLRTENLRNGAGSWGERERSEPVTMETRAAHAWGVFGNFLPRRLHG